MAQIYRIISLFSTLFHGLFRLLSVMFISKDFMVNLILYSFDIIYIAHLSHSFAILIAVDFKTNKSLINSSTQDLRSFGVTYENTYISLISVSTDTLWRLN